MLQFSIFINFLINGFKVKVKPHLFYLVMRMKNYSKSIIKKITSYLEDNNDLLDYEILDKDLIQGSLGIKDKRNFRIIITLCFLIQSADEQIIDEVYTSILKLGDNRILEKYSHKDQLFEVMSLFKRVKIIIFSMILMISILLAFLVLNITKAALISNFKLIKMIQIMGESSYELAKNVSISIIK